MRIKGVDGFTLVEVLIALAIVAIALTAIVKAVGDNIKNTHYIQQKTTANWVATNVIASIQLGLINPPAQDQTRLLGQTWGWTARQEPTDDKNTLKISVSVFKDPSHTPLLTLWSYKSIYG